MRILLVVPMVPRSDGPGAIPMLLRAQLTGLQERRRFECRLTPDRALQTLAEAEAFLRGRGLLTRTVSCALPSLFEACHEDPYQPGSPGFAAWPATKWPWFGELADRGHLITAVHSGKSLLISGAVARLVAAERAATGDRIATGDARSLRTRLTGTTPRTPRVVSHEATPRAEIHDASSESILP